MSVKVEFKPNKISFDEAGFRSEIRTYVRFALDEAEEEYIKLMREGVDETVTAPNEWLDGIKESIRHLETIMEGDIITYVTGVSSPEGSAAWMRAMVVAYGMGELGLNGNMIFAGPYGRSVWDNDLAGKTTSKVTRVHEIPTDDEESPGYKTWYHAGSWFIQNATANMRVRYNDTMQAALEVLPADIVSRHIIVSG